MFMSNASLGENATTYGDIITGQANEDCVIIEHADSGSGGGALVSESAVKYVDVIVNGVCLPALFLISTVTNCINMAAFCKQGLGERINLCLFCLALCDLLYILFCFCFYADTLYLFFADPTTLHGYKPARQFWLEHDTFCLFSFGWASAFTSCVIACERCFCVISPFTSKKVLQTKTMAAILLVAYTILVGGFQVVGSKYTIVCAVDSLTNVTTSIVYPSKYYFENKFLLDLIEGVVYGFGVSGLALFLTTAATVITVVQLKKMATQRRHMSSSDVISAREVALTRMLVGTSILYVASCFPALVFHVLSLLFPGVSMGGTYQNTLELVTALALLLSYINSSFNFFIYYNIGSNYRSVVREMFRCCCRSK